MFCPGIFSIIIKKCNDICTVGALRLTCRKFNEIIALEKIVRRSTLARGLSPSGCLSCGRALVCFDEDEPFQGEDGQCVWNPCCDDCDYRFCENCVAIYHICGCGRSMCYLVGHSGFHAQTECWLINGGGVVYCHRDQWATDAAIIIYDEERACVPVSATEYDEMYDSIWQAGGQPWCEERVIFSATRTDFLLTGPDGGFSHTWCCNVCNSTYACSDK